MDIVYVGWDHRGAPLSLRERLSFTPEKARDALEGLFKERILSEGAIVSTCNRAEVYGLTEREDDFSALSLFFSQFHHVEDEVLRSAASSGRGDVAVRHLFRVAAGLDSMVLGEAQILGQIRDAHRFAHASGAAHAVTNRLFQMALECGKKVRADTALGHRPMSVPGLALSLAGRIFESLSGRAVLLLGAGEIAELTARLLVDDGVSDLRICNRSPEKAESLARVVGGKAVPWESRAEQLGHVDVIISATGATEPVITAPVLKKALGRNRRGPLLILDLAVPRDVDQAVDDLEDVYRYDVDGLKTLAERNAAERRSEVPKAETIVEESLARFNEWYGGLSQVAVVKGLREKLEALRRQELERFGGKLGHLGDDDRAIVERLTESIVAKILHDPTVGLKEGDAAERVVRAAAVKALFKLEGRN